APGPFRDEVGRDPERLRVAFSAASPIGTHVHEDCGRAVADAASLLASLGHDVEEAAPEVDAEHLGAVFDVLWTVGVAAEVGAWARSLDRMPAPEDVEVLTWAMYELGTKRSAVDYLLAVEDMHRIGRRVAEFHEHF